MEKNGITCSSINAVNELAKHSHQNSNGNIWMAYWGPASKRTENVAAHFVSTGTYAFVVEDNRGYGIVTPASITSKTTGSGGAHNNMPAYQTLYAWRRTA